MIKFKSFLNEGKTFSQQEFISEVKEKCSDFLANNSKDNLVYRGIRNLKDDYQVMVPRANRQPADMPLQYHEVFDNYFKEKFNFRYRSASIFCVRDIKEAKRYGTVYVIFPSNGYKFCASNVVHDLWQEITMDPLDIFNVNKYSDEYYQLKDEHFEFKHHGDLTFIDKFMKKANYFETQKLTDVAPEHELMLQCENYYVARLIYTGWETTEELISAIYK